MNAGHPHTHDNIDWTARLTHMQRANALDRSGHQQVAERLVGALPAGATVLDVGAGAGGMAAAFAEVLARGGAGRVVLVDAVPELLDAATEHTRSVAGPVEVIAVRADAADDALADLVPAADLVWASGVVHHLPDQQRGVATLARAVRPGGRLALREGGLTTQTLPWDLGIGEPGLQERVNAASNTWFGQMRSSMPGSVRLAGGWGGALRTAGLRDVTAFSYLTDHPAPAPQPVRDAVVDWLTWTAEICAEHLSDADRDTLARLIDPHSEAFAGARDDVFLLSASTVHLGTRPVSDTQA